MRGKAIIFIGRHLYLHSLLQLLNASYCKGIYLHSTT